jgi:tight adherence protein C
MAIFVCAVLFLVMSLAIAGFGYLRFVKPSAMLDQLAATTSSGPAVAADLALDDPATDFVPRTLASLGKLMPLSPADLELKKRELSAAGFRSSHAVPAFVGIRIVLCIGMLALAFYARTYISDKPLNRMIIPIAGGIAGYLLPGFALARLTKKRQESIRLALPDVLDLLVISTEAGCALDRAILNVSREFKDHHKAISEEMFLMNMEMLAGASRTDALRNFARRTGDDEIKKLVAILIQTDRFGTSIADALRTQSEFLRVRRRQIAEERAGKVGVKLIFPIFFFCMPSLMVLVAGPGLLQIFTNLLPSMNNFH